MPKPKLIENPARMWELFENYKRLLKLNPIIVVDYVGGKGSRAEREKERPLTMEGFREYCYSESLTIKHYFDNTDNRYSEYSTICLRIKDAIRLDQIEGGMAGIYNPSITQRLNGLVEKTQTDLNANVNILNIDPLE
jgi:hypothetical protein